MFSVWRDHHIELNNYIANQCSGTGIVCGICVNIDQLLLHTLLFNLRMSHFWLCRHSNYRHKVGNTKENSGQYCHVLQVEVDKGSDMKCSPFPGSGNFGFCVSSIMHTTFSCGVDEFPALVSHYVLFCLVLHVMSETTNSQRTEYVPQSGRFL